MSQETKLAQVIDQVQMYWSPRFMAELRADLLLGGYVNKDYEGEIKQGGDTVRVSQIIAPTGQLLDAQTDDSFESEVITTTKIDIKADKRAVSSFEFHDIVDLQSLITKDRPDVMEALKYAISNQINNYLFTFVKSSADVTGVTTFGTSNLQAARKFAGQKKWLKDGRWVALLDPSYYTDILGVVGLTSSDFTDDRSVQSGNVDNKRFGFAINEDNSRPNQYGLFFHPDFLHMVMQQGVSIKISDLHAQKRFGYVMSVDTIFGAALGIDGNNKHYYVKNT